MKTAASASRLHWVSQMCHWLAGRRSGARNARIATALAGCLIASTAMAAPTYYVAISGSDHNAGSKAKPFRTIQRAVDNTTGAAKILIRSGIYFETVDIHTSGSAASGYLTIRNYGSEKVIVDGAGQRIETGQGGLFTITNQSYVRIRGLELQNFRSTTTAVPMGISVSGRGEHIQIIGNHIHHIETRYPGCDGNALGIGIYGDNARESLSAIEISHNELDHLATGCSESMSLNGNVDNFLIINNKIHDTNNIGIDIIGFEGTSGDPATDQARNGVIRGNTLYNISSYGNSAYGAHVYAADAIYVDGGRDVIIERNRIHHADIGIELASENRKRMTSNVTVRNNLVYWSNLTGISIGDYDKKVGGTVNCRIVNNTLYQNDTKKTWSGELQIQYNASNNLFKNNIMVANDQGLFVNAAYKSAAAPAVIDYNVYYTPAGESNAQFSWNSKSYESLAAFRKASGHAAAASFANPVLAAVGNSASFALKKSSPAINAGLTMDTQLLGTADFAGKTRIKAGSVDAGAVEF